MTKMVRKAVARAVGRSARWISERLRPGAGLFLRGACTALGNAAVGFLVLWVHARY